MDGKLILFILLMVGFVLAGKFVTDFLVNGPRERTPNYDDPDYQEAQRRQVRAQVKAEREEKERQQRKLEKERHEQRLKEISEQQRQEKVAEREFHRKAEEQIAKIFGFRLHHHKDEHLYKLKNELDKAKEQKSKVDIIYSNDAGDDLYLQTISNIQYPPYYTVHSDSCFTAYCHQDYKEKKYKITRIGSVNIL